MSWTHLLLASLFWLLQKCLLFGRSRRTARTVLEICAEGPRGSEEPAGEVIYKLRHLPPSCSPCFTSVRKLTLHASESKLIKTTFQSLVTFCPSSADPMAHCSSYVKASTGSSPSGQGRKSASRQADCQSRCLRSLQQGPEPPPIS